MAGAGLFWEKSTTGWLLVADLFWEKNTAGWWLISQTNRARSLGHQRLYSTPPLQGGNSTGRVVPFLMEAKHTRPCQLPRWMAQNRPWTRPWQCGYVNLFAVTLWVYVWARAVAGLVPCLTEPMPLHGWTTWQRRIPATLFRIQSRLVNVSRLLFRHRFLSRSVPAP
jgi:hypothetical protein